MPIVVVAICDITNVKIVALISAAILIGGPCKGSAQELGISKVNRASTALEIELTLTNSSARDFLVVSPNPRQRSQTEQFLTFDSQTKDLQINRLFYSYPSYVLIGIVFDLEFLQ